MATYKVLQDIEAEDKLLGPLTLKQFIFAIIFIAIGFINFKIATNASLSIVRWPVVLGLMLPMLIFGFLAAPISRDQPNDVWLLARLRFLIKPHKRIWNQDGISQLVTITAPKKLERIFTNGLNANEVQSRLSALASTLDSRGWAIKNVDVNMFAQPGYLATSDGSDRLVAPSNLPVTQSTVDIQAADDMLDAQNNPTAQHLEQMVQASTASHRQRVLSRVQGRETPTATAGADYWFLNQPPVAPKGLTTFQNTSVVTPGSTDLNAAQPTAEEKALIAKIEADKASTAGHPSHMKTIQPLSAQGTPAPQTQSVLPPIQSPVQNQPNPHPPAGGTTPNPAILSLASNDDLNVATIARQAQRISESDGEVVISLH